jgi:RNA polymerase sigma factor (sigma-70 family)
VGREVDLGPADPSTTFADLAVDDANTPLNEDIADEQLGALRWCLTLLSEEDQAALRARYYDKMKMSEAAEQLGVSPRLFGYRLKKAEENLRKAFRNRVGVRSS